jgi:hypothetical protein
LNVKPADCVASLPSNAVDLVRAAANQTSQGPHPQKEGISVPAYSRRARANLLNIFDDRFRRFSRIAVCAREGRLIEPTSVTAGPVFIHPTGS